MRINQVRLGDYCSITSSKRIFESEYVSEGVPFFRSKEIIERESGKVNSVSIFISQKRYDEIKEKFGVPQVGDVLLTSVGTLGIPYVIKENDLFYFKDGNLTWMRDFSPEMNSKYLYYWLRSSFGKQSLIQRAIGSSQAAITIDILKKYQLLLPPIEQQEIIITFLSTYDDLIEKNNRKITILQEQTQEIYKEWFVRFRFPGYETAKFENGLPVGWEIVTLGDYAEIIMGQSPESCYYNMDKEGLPFHQGVGSYGDWYLQDDTYSTDGKRIAEPNSIIFSVRAPVGRLNITINKIILGRGVASINAKDNHNDFLFWLLKTTYSKEDLIGNGSIFASVTKDELFKQKLVIPDDNLLCKFDLFAHYIEKQIRALYFKNKLLTQQRDLLLPRLMSGKLEA